MEKKEVQQVSDMISMAACRAAKEYPNLRETLVKLVEIFNKRASREQKGAIYAVLDQYRLIAAVAGPKPAAVKTQQPNTNQQ